MDKNNTKETWINVFTATIFSCLLIYLYRSVGELIAFVQLFPIIVLYVNDGKKAAMMALIATTIAAVLMLDIISAIYIMIFIIIGSLYIGYSINKNMPVGPMIFRIAILKLITIIGLIAYSHFALGVNFLDEVRGAFLDNLDMVTTEMSKNIEITSSQIEAYRSTFRMAVEGSIEVMPALLFIASFTVVFVNVIIALKVLKRTRTDIKYVTKLNLYGIGPEIRYAALVMIIGVTVMYLFNLPNVKVAYTNVAVILGYFFFFNGLFLGDFIYFRRGNGLMRVVIPFLMLVVFQAYFAYVVLGAIDMFANFRRRILINEFKIRK